MSSNPTLQGIVVSMASGDPAAVAPGSGGAPSGNSQPQPPQAQVGAAVLGDLGEPPAPRQHYPHIVAQRGDAISSASHAFSFEGREFTVAVGIDPTIYWGAVASTRAVSTTNAESKDDVATAISRYMVQDPVQAAVIDSVCARLRTIADKRGLDSDRYVELIAKYVQTMPYDFDKLAVPTANARFPVETLVERTGVCSDKSMLMVALLAHEGYDVALLAFEAENHMTAGIKGPGTQYRNSGYLLIESTQPAYIAEIPEQFVSGIRLQSEAHVIPIGTGKTAYGSASRTARILQVRESAQAAGQALSASAQGKMLTVEQANKINAQLQTVYESQFMFSAIDGHAEKFLDSTAAELWIRKNCWWD